jgi:hypothetical protein
MKWKATNRNNGLNWTITDDQKKALEAGIFKKSFVFEPLEDTKKTIATPPEAKPSKKKKAAPKEGEK